MDGEKCETDEVEFVCGQMLKVFSLINKYGFLINAHATEFITKSHWECLVPPGIKDELLKLSEYQLQLLPDITKFLSDVELHPSDQASGSSEPQIEWHHKNLYEFLRDVKRCQLEELNVLKSFHDCDVVVEPNVRGESGEQLLSVQKDSRFSSNGNVFMNDKKSHEVEIMADICSSLYMKYATDIIVDIGSGKGYLGTQLASIHNIPVVGIDSSCTNTTGAIKRTNLFLKQRKDLNKKATSSDLVSSNLENLSLGNPSQSDLKHQSLENEIKKGVKKKRDNILNYFPLTHFIDESTRLSDVIATEENIVGSHDKLEKVFLTGLHTCGNLASNIIRHFLKDSSVKVLCYVGCCYQLMDEEFSETAGSDFSIRKSPSSKVSYGFPLCSQLRAKRCFLGKTALNLAAQSPQRIQMSSQLQGRTFFKRALLQKIIEDIFGKDVTIKGLRNVDKKSPTFRDYVYNSFKKLGLDTDKICDEVIDDYDKRYKDEEKKLAAFFQLRAALAPCIETLILLDRFIFLLEQDCVKEARLVRLFDARVSPRCYGIFAVKQ